MIRRSAFFLSCLALSACVKSRTEATPPSEDAGATAASSSPYDGGGILQNGGFENGCDKWATDNGRLVPFAGGRHGAGCLACSTGTAMRVRQALYLGMDAGIDFRAEVYVRRAPPDMGAAPTTPGSLHLVFYKDLTTSEVGGATNGNAASDAFTLVANTYRTTKPAELVEFVFSIADVPAGVCVVLDDARLYEGP